jgi:hypothetical protein
MAIRRVRRLAEFSIGEITPGSSSGRLWRFERRQGPPFLERTHYLPLIVAPRLHRALDGPYFYRCAFQVCSTPIAGRRHLRKSNWLPVLALS